MTRACWLLPLLALGCAEPANLVDFGPIRPGVCDEPGVECEDGRAWVEVTPEYATPRRFTFVIDALAIPRADEEAGVAVGIDLDGVDSGEGSTDVDATCAEYTPDFASGVEPGLAGIDNSLQGLVGTIEGLLDPADCPGGSTEGCLDAAFAERIASGELVRVIEIEGVDGLTTDDEVLVRVHEGRILVAPGEAPALDPSGRLAPGQRVEVEVPGETGTGTVLNGRLAFAVDLVTLLLDAGDFSLQLPLREARLRATLGEDRLEDGVLGGALVVDDIDTSPDFPACDTIASTVDLSLSGYTCCWGPPACCNAVSAGLAFSAVEAELVFP